MENTGVQGRIPARIALAWALLFVQGTTSAEESYRVAVLAFRGDGGPSSTVSRAVTDLVATRLSAEPQVRLVERQEIADSLGELGLSLSGLVKDTEAVRVEKLAGAQKHKTAVDLPAPLATGKALRQTTAAIAPDFVVRLVEACKR